MPVIDYRQSAAEFDDFGEMDFTQSRHTSTPTPDDAAPEASNEEHSAPTVISAFVITGETPVVDIVAPTKAVEAVAEPTGSPRAEVSRTLPVVDFEELEVPDFSRETVPSVDTRSVESGIPSDSSAREEEEQRAAEGRRTASRVSVAHQGKVGSVAALLDPGFALSLRPMRYPHFYERYRQAIANTWSVEEVDFTGDIADLRERVTPAQRHVIQRLVAFFATGDTIVANNLVLSLYRHLNAPEARLYLSRQLFEEAQHIQFYLTLLDAYLPSDNDRNQAFAAVEHIPSIRRKADFCFEWTDAVMALERISNEDEARLFLQNLTAFAAGVEGLFFFGAFAYVYYLRSRGLFNGLATGTNWVFRDESMHMNFAFDAIEVIRSEAPQLFDTNFKDKVHRMLDDAVACEMAFAKDLLEDGVAGLSLRDMDAYLKNVADRRLENLGYSAVYKTRNPFDFMELQDVQEVTNFFERRVSSYQVGVQGDVALDETF